MPLELVAGVEASPAGTNAPRADRRCTPHEVVGRDVERDGPPWCAMRSTALPTVVLHRDDLRDTVSVEHLRADRIRLDELADRDEAFGRAHERVVRLARARLLRHALDADVEPHRAVERRPLGDEDVLQLVGERRGLGVVAEVAAFEAPAGDRVDDAVDDLAQRGLTLGGAERAAEVLLGDDVGGVLRPVGGELDVGLLEGDRAVGLSW